MSIVKKSKLFWSFGALLLGLITFVTAGVNVYASEESVNDIVDNELVTSEKDVYVAGEYLGKIIVSEQPEIAIRSLIHSETVQNKNYNIHFIGGTANVGFGIKVQNKKITNAYDPWANGLGWSITPGNLTFNSREARLPGSFSVAWKGFPAGSTFRLRAVISGNQLETYLDIP